MFNDQQLKDWMEGFFGYGNRQGRYWLVGIEEGGGGSPADVQARLDTWMALGRPLFDDPAAFHEHPLMNSPVRLKPRDMPKRFFQMPIKSQSTWCPLARLVLSAEGNEPSDPSPERVQKYQAKDLGRLDKKTLLTELLPLPSPGRKIPLDPQKWLYGNLSNLPYLKTRNQYEAEVMPRRARRLKTLVAQYAPPAVVFYSSDPDFRHSWQEIAGAAFTTVSASGIEVAHHNGTVFMIIDHPVSHGSHDYFLEAGRILALEMERIKTQSTPYVYSTRPPKGTRDRSLYHRFWRRFLPSNAMMPAPFVSFPCSTKNLPTSFHYELSIAGRWAVSQFNVPLEASSAAQAQALKALATTLKGLPIYNTSMGPFVTVEENGVLYIKWVYRGDVIDASGWPALQGNMLQAMGDLVKALALLI